MKQYDLVIIGSGVAGLTAALAAAGRAHTLLLTKASLDESNTRYAQGGIAAAIGPDDSVELHLDDTIVAGNGIVDRHAAGTLTAEARAAIDELVRLGVPFDRDGERIALGREAAHSAKRILHAGGDATGAHLERTLTERVRASGVELREQTFVSRLLAERGQVTGVETLDCLSGAITSIEANAVILATGGAGQLYSHTTNPTVATADGIALAYAIGAELMDMEFIQFHPTALRLAGAPSFLISEAVRGEGAILRSRDGRAFMAEYHPRRELAPRDVVARAIHAEMARDHADCVYLDLTHLPAQRVYSRFPQIDAFCRSHGIDIAHDPIPVAPAAHYTMGGVRTTAWGETNVGGLFACGEVACTGVHGANRLASNSLLEGLVFGRRTLDRALPPVAAQACDPAALALPAPESAETDRPTLGGAAAPDVGGRRHRPLGRRPRARAWRSPPGPRPKTRQQAVRSLPHATRMSWRIWSSPAGWSSKRRGGERRAAAHTTDRITPRRLEIGSDTKCSGGLETEWSTGDRRPYPGARATRPPPLMGLAQKTKREWRAPRTLPVPGRALTLTLSLREREASPRRPQRLRATNRRHSRERSGTWFRVQQRASSSAVPPTAPLSSSMPGCWRRWRGRR